MPHPSPPTHPNPRCRFFFFFFWLLAAHTPLPRTPCCNHPPTPGVKRKKNPDSSHHVLKRITFTNKITWVKKNNSVSFLNIFLANKHATKLSSVWNKYSKQCFPPCDKIYLIHFIHPVAGKFKHQFTGLYRSRHRSAVQRAGSRLKYPPLWLLLLPSPLHFSFASQNGSLCSVLFSNPSSVKTRGEKPRAGVFSAVPWPRWEQPRPALTQRPGPAAPGASTPAGEMERG